MFISFTNLINVESIHCIYLYENILNILIQHLDKCESNPINIKYLLGHFKTSN